MQVVCAVYDSKLEAFLLPIVFPNTAIAVRQFQALVQQPDMDFHKFSEDYTLFHIADFDEKSGVITPLSTPKSIVLASLLKSNGGSDGSAR